MKKLKFIAIFLLLIVFISGCGSNKKAEKEPDISQIRAICDLATLKTIYHNVAEVTKEGNLFQKKRVMWIEYTGIAQIGIDLNKVDMKVKGDTITVTLPKAKLLNSKVDENSIDENSYYYSEDNKLLFKNEFSAKDQTEAIKDAQKNMKKNINNNKQLLRLAQDRAKDLIEKYLIELGKASGKEYNIKWVLEN